MRSLGRVGVMLLVRHSIGTKMRSDLRCLHGRYTGEKLRNTVIVAASAVCGLRKALCSDVGCDPRR